MGPHPTNAGALVRVGSAPPSGPGAGPGREWVGEGTSRGWADGCGQAFTLFLFSLVAALVPPSVSFLEGWQVPAPRAEQAWCAFPEAVWCGGVRPLPRRAPGSCPTRSAGPVGPVVDKARGPSQHSPQPGLAQALVVPVRRGLWAGVLWAALGWASGPWARQGWASALLVAHVLGWEALSQAQDSGPVAVQPLGFWLGLGHQGLDSGPDMGAGCSSQETPVPPRSSGHPSP